MYPSDRCLEMEIIKQHLESFKLLGQRGFMSELLEKGTGYTPDKDAVSLVYNHKHLLKSINQKECYKNSLLAALVIPGLEYWEGYYVTEGIPLALNHTFNVENGKVVDFTAIKFNINVTEYWGIRVPHKVLEDYVKTDQWLTALQFYLQKTIKK